MILKAMELREYRLFSHTMHTDYCFPLLYSYKFSLAFFPSRSTPSLSTIQNMDLFGIVNFYYAPVLETEVQERSI